MQNHTAHNVAAAGAAKVTEVKEAAERRAMEVEEVTQRAIMRAQAGVDQVRKGV